MIDRQLVIKDIQNTYKDLGADDLRKVGILLLNKRKEFRTKTVYITSNVPSIANEIKEYLTLIENRMNLEAEVVMGLWRSKK